MAGDLSSFSPQEGFQTSIFFLILPMLTDCCCTWYATFVRSSQVCVYGIVCTNSELVKLCQRFSRLLCLYIKMHGNCSASPLQCSLVKRNSQLYISKGVLLKKLSFGIIRRPAFLLSQFLVPQLESLCNIFQTPCY